MIGADLVRFGVFAALPFAASAGAIVALAAVAGFATGFFRPAVYAGLPNLVDDADLPRANSLFQTVDNLTWVLGPLLGGVLVAGSGPGPRLLVNAVHVPRLRAAHRRGSRRGCCRRRRRQPRPLARPRGRVRARLPLARAPDRARRLERRDGRERGGQRRRRSSRARSPSTRATSGSACSWAASGVGLAVGSLLAGSWLERRGSAPSTAASIGLMAVGFGAAPRSRRTSGSRPRCVVVSGVGQRRRRRLQRAARPARRAGRAARPRLHGGHELNFAVLGLGMVVAGPLTDASARAGSGPARRVVALAVAAALGCALAASRPDEPLRAAVVAVPRP